MTCRRWKINQLSVEGWVHWVCSITWYHFLLEWKTYRQNDLTSHFDVRGNVYVRVLITQCLVGNKLNIHLNILANMSWRKECHSQESALLPRPYTCYNVMMVKTACSFLPSESCQHFIKLELPPFVPPSRVPISVLRTPVEASILSNSHIPWSVFFFCHRWGLWKQLHNNRITSSWCIDNNRLPSLITMEAINLGVAWYLRWYHQISDSSWTSGLALGMRLVKRQSSNLV